MAMDKYYIVKLGQNMPQGPYDFGVIKALYASGRITRDYYYCKVGGTQWQPLPSIFSPTVQTPDVATQVYPTPPVFPMAQIPAGIGTPIVRPDNQLVWSILVTIFCCLPFGIYSIIKSASVDTLWSQGNYQAAVLAAAEAKKWNTIGGIVGGVILLLSIALNLIAGMV